MPTALQLLKDQDALFSVKKQPLYRQADDGSMVRVEDAFSLVRADTQAVMSKYVSKDYVPVSNDTFAKVIDAWIDHASAQGKKLTPDRCLVYRGGTRMAILVNREDLRAEIFPGDEVLGVMSFMWGHRDFPLVVSQHLERMRCLNQAQMFLREGALSGNLVKFFHKGTPLAGILDALGNPHLGAEVVAHLEGAGHETKGSFKSIMDASVDLFERRHEAHVNQLRTMAAFRLPNPDVTLPLLVQVSFEDSGPTTEGGRDRPHYAAIQELFTEGMGHDLHSGSLYHAKNAIDQYVDHVFGAKPREPHRDEPDLTYQSFVRSFNATKQASRILGREAEIKSRAAYAAEMFMTEPDPIGWLKAEAKRFDAPPGKSRNTVGPND